MAEYPYLRLEEADGFFTAERYKDAIRCYREIYCNFPSPSIAYKMSASYQRLSRHLKALKWLERAIAGGLDDADAQNTRGWLYERLGRSREAEAAYREALEHDAGHRAASYNLASLLSRKSARADWAECVELCDKLLEAGRDREVEYMRGLIKVRLGDHDGALEDANDLVSGFPDYAKGYKARSIILQVMGIHAAADEDYARFLSFF